MLAIMQAVFLCRPSAAGYICQKVRPLRLLFSLIIGLLSLAGSAQIPTYQYQISLNEEARSLTGSASLSFHNTGTTALQKLWLQLPPRALENEHSFLHQQFIEFQKSRLHFADSNERGFILTSNWQSDQVFFSVKDSLEWLKLSLSDVLPPGDSVVLHFDFFIKLPPLDFYGVGYGENSFRLIDWLPVLSPFEEGRFRFYPQTWQRDLAPQLADYQLNVELPSHYLIASNARIESEAEIALMASLTERLFHKLPPDGQRKTVHLSHRGTNLQLFLSPDFYLFDRANGEGYLFLESVQPALPARFETADSLSKMYLHSEWGLDLPDDYNVVIVKDKVNDYQSDRLLSLEESTEVDALATALLLAKAESHIRYRMRANGFKQVWLARGLPYYYQYDFIARQYPDKKWLSFNTKYTRPFYRISPPFFEGLEEVLGLNQFDRGYQNEFLFHFLARQGLDQAMSTPADSLSRLNYTAIAQAKTFMSLRHLRAYMGDREFKRGMHRFLSNDSIMASPARLQADLEYYSNRSLDWYFKDWIHSAEQVDYQLKKFEHCPTITTATVVNHGQLAIPFSLTGFKEGKKILTEWFEGHHHKKSVLMYHADYDRVVLNYHGYTGELERRNNSVGSGLLPAVEPLRFRLYQSFENPEYTQVLFMPTVNYNAYDRLLLGVTFYNESLVKKKWEYIIGPEFSFGQKELTGYGSLEYNHIPAKSSVFRRIKAGLYSRYYHYDEELAYWRLSPGLRFYLRKPYPTSSLIRQISLRSVHVKRELAEGFDDIRNEVGNASYDVLNLRYTQQETNVLHPHTIQADFMLGDQFSRLSLEGDFRRLLPNRKWLIWRSFVGVFLSNSYYQQGFENSYYSLGLSGTRDFLFDYNFLGRSDQDGIWSHQFFTTEGGFKGATGEFADRWMFTSNLVVPLWQVIGVFGDIGLLDDASETFFDYGVRLALISDFAEIYFPAGNNHDLYLYNNRHYAENIRFVFNLDLGSIIERVRWGYY